MAKGDNVTNGLIFGALFGALVYYVAVQPNSFLSFIGTGVNSLGNWIAHFSWFPASMKVVAGTVTTAAKWFYYTIAIVIGSAIGAAVDYK